MVCYELYMAKKCKSGDHLQEIINKKRKEKYFNEP